MIKFIPLLLISFHQLAYSCGGWGFTDLEKKWTLGFLASSIELDDPTRDNPRFIRAGKNRAFFANGERIYFRGTDIELQTFTGLNQNKKRTFKKEIIGKFSKNILTVGNQTFNFSTKKAQQEYLVTVKSNENKVGAGKIVLFCLEGPAKKKDSDEEFFQFELKRLVSYYVWKTRNIDPFFYTKEFDWTW